MKTYILTVDEGYGEYVYAVFAETFRDAYEKIKNDEEFDLKVNDELMKNIKEFRELNLTWQEYEAGVDVDSPDREEGIVFTSMYDVKSSEDWYTKDFIDLDAFVQDVVYSVLLEEEADNNA